MYSKNKILLVSYYLSSIMQSMVFVGLNLAAGMTNVTPYCMLAIIEATAPNV